MLGRFKNCWLLNIAMNHLGLDCFMSSHHFLITASSDLTNGFLRLEAFTITISSSAQTHLRIIVSGCSWNVTVQKSIFIVFIKVVVFSSRTDIHME